MADPDGGINQNDLDDLVRDIGTGRYTKDRRYTLTLSLVDGCPCLKIGGMVLQAIPDEFTKRMRELLVGSDKPIVVDLRECTYLCSTALGALTYLFSAAPRVILLKPNAKILNMIRLIGWEHMLTLVEDDGAVEAAIKNAPPPQAMPERAPE
jgi:hypothetical protein